MASFCGNCGTPATGGRFCLKCGSQLPAAGPPPLQSAVPPNNVYGQVPKKSPVLKIVLISLVAVLFIGAAGTVGLVLYIKSKVHDKLAQMKDQTGVDVSEQISSVFGNKVRRPTKDGCLLLTKDEAGSILGVTIVRTTGNEPGTSSEYCNYYADEKDLEKSRTAAAEDRLPTGRTDDAAQQLAQVEDMVKKMVASANNGSTPLLQVTVYRGDAQMAEATFATANVLMGTKVPSVPGPWDQAVFGPMNSLLSMRKGENGVLIDLRQIPQAHEKGLAMAKLIAGRIAD